MVLMKAERALPEPKPGSDRFVIRPQRWAVVVATLTLGITGLLPAAIGLYALIKGQPAGLIFLFIALFSWSMIYVAVGGELWADSERVGNTRLFERRVCRRDELAYLKMGVPLGRSGAPFFFIRKDGSVALRTVAWVWGTAKLKSLAAFLDLPVLDARHPVKHVCPVCGYTGLEEPASSNGRGSGEMCPSCGFDFTGAVDEARYAEWREQWVRGGMAWWAAQAGRPAPYDWNPTTQLKALTG